MKRFGLAATLDRPLLSDLAKRFADDIGNPREQKRARRVLGYFCDLLTRNTCVGEVSKADGKRYIDKRMKDGLKAQSIDRELNIIVAMFNKGDTYFEQLAQWRPPRLPRPKIIDGRRERTWSEHEIKVILRELFAPKRDDEQTQAAIARYRVGRKIQFSLLNARYESDRAKPVTTKSSVRLDQLRWNFFASFTTLQKQICCFHVAAIFHQSFTGFSETLVKAREFRTVVARAMA